MTRFVTFLDQAYIEARALGDADAQLVFLAVGWALVRLARLEPRRPALGVCGAGCRRAPPRRRLHVDHRRSMTMRRRNNSAAFRTSARGRPLTLGERKSLARTHDRSLIQRVVRDPHPDVIRILLDNPSLTEEDVGRVCAQRGRTTPNVLQTVYRASTLGGALPTAERDRAKPRYATRHRACCWRRCLRPRRASRRQPPHPSWRQRFA